MNSLVSIIIPVYNSEKYLQQCYSSIKNQTYQDLEIIFIDDGSIDNSYEICKNIQRLDSRVIVKHQENGGVSKARNNGILTAKGEVILFVDADDILDQTYVELLSKPVISKKYDMAICGYIDIFKNHHKKNIDVNNIILEFDFSRDFNKIFPLIFSVWNIAYSKSVILNNKILFNEEMRQGEDVYFNICYCKYINNFFLVKKYLYQYFHRNNNSLNQNVYFKDFEKYIIRLEALKSLLIQRNVNKANNILLNYAKRGVIKFSCLNENGDSYSYFKDRCKKIQKNSFINNEISTLTVFENIFRSLLKYPWLIYTILLVKRNLRKYIM
mgnify:CR=1 FL=1